MCTMLCALVLVMASPSAQEPSGVLPSHAVFDQMLDVNVRDGLVYYRVLRAGRANLDSYVASLANVSLKTASRDEQIAFWLNAYNAIVLKIVADNYPIAQRTGDYPPHSIRQIPGAFDRVPHRVAAQALTLDRIEQTVLAGFHDPRVFLALGRGAVGGGRLRSEAFTAERLDRQLAGVQAECVTRAECVQISPADGRVQASAIFSWRRSEFIERYAGESASTFSNRSPIEQAVLAFVGPQLYAAEREFLAKNTFKVEYLPFDWSLNDLTNH
jgi:Protein of unknown function, DUF547